MPSTEVLKVLYLGRKSPVVVAKRSFSEAMAVSTAARDFVTSAAAASSSLDALVPAALGSEAHPPSGLSSINPSPTTPTNVETVFILHLRSWVDDPEGPPRPCVHGNRPTAAAPDHAAVHLPVSPLAVCSGSAGQEEQP